MSDQKELKSVVEQRLKHVKSYYKSYLDTTDGKRELEEAELAHAQLTDLLATLDARAIIIKSNGIALDEMGKALGIYLRNGHTKPCPKVDDKDAICSCGCDTAINVYSKYLKD